MCGGVCVPCGGRCVEGCVPCEGCVCGGICVPCGGMCVWRYVCTLWRYVCTLWRYVCVEACGGMCVCGGLWRYVCVEGVYLVEGVCVEGVYPEMYWMHISNTGRVCTTVVEV